MSNLGFIVIAIGAFIKYPALYNNNVSLFSIGLESFNMLIGLTCCQRLDLPIHTHGELYLLLIYNLIILFKYKSTIQVLFMGILFYIIRLYLLEMELNILVLLTYLSIPINLYLFYPMIQDLRKSRKGITVESKIGYSFIMLIWGCLMGTARWLSIYLDIGLQFWPLFQASISPIMTFYLILLYNKLKVRRKRE